MLEELTSSAAFNGPQTILIGAVDNNRSRQMCHEVFQESRNIIYIDSGNGEYTGQIVCGIRKNGRTITKPVAGIYPDILQGDEKFPTELSCAERSVSGTAEHSRQFICINYCCVNIISVDYMR